MSRFGDLIGGKAPAPAPAPAPEPVVEPVVEEAPAPEPAPLSNNSPRKLRRRSSK